MELIQIRFDSYQLPEITKHGETIGFIVGDKRALIKSSDRIIVSGLMGRAVGKTVSSADVDSYLVLESTIITNDFGEVIDRLWVSTKISGTWQIE